MERQRGPEINRAGHYSLPVPAAEHILVRGGKSVGDGGDGIAPKTLIALSVYIIFCTTWSRNTWNNYLVQQRTASSLLCNQPHLLSTSDVMERQ